MDRSANFIDSDTPQASYDNGEDLLRQARTANIGFVLTTIERDGDEDSFNTVGRGSDLDTLKIAYQLLYCLAEAGYKVLELPIMLLGSIIEENRESKPSGAPQTETIQ